MASKNPDKTWIKFSIHPLAKKNANIVAAKTGRRLNEWIKFLIKREIDKAGGMQAKPKKLEKKEGLFSVRVTAKERKAFLEKIERQGHSINSTLISCIRAYINRDPDFTREEIDALWKNRTELLSIGRNINSISKKMNQGDLNALTTLTPDDLARVRDAVLLTISRIEDLRAATRNRRIRL